MKQLKTQAVQLLIMLILATWVSCTTNTTSSNDTSTNTTTGVQFQAAAPITTEALTTDDIATLVRRLYSKMPQTVSIQTASSGTQTLVKMLRVNRKSTPQYETFPVTLTGSYDSIKSTTDSLSCILYKNTGSDQYKMTTFNSQMSTFTAVSDSAVSSLSFSGLDSSSDVTVGDQCSRINNAGTIYQLSSDGNSYAAVSGGSSVTAASEDMMYVMASNVLLKYNAATDMFDNLNTFDATFTAFRVKSYSNRILVVGVKVSGTSREQSFWVYTQTGGALTQIGSMFTVTGQISDATQFITYLASPALTKFTVTYYPSLMGDPVSAFKSINYDISLMGDMVLYDQAQYTALIRDTGLALSDYSFGDYYFIFRTTPLGGNPLETSYQFMGNRVYYLRDQQNTDGYSVSKLIVDENYDSRLVIVNFAETSATALAINQFDYGSLQTVKRVKIEAPASQVDVSVPSFTNSYQSIEQFLWLYIQVSGGSSLFTLRYYDPTATNKVYDATYTKTGSWSAITQNTQCMLIQESPANNFILARYTRASDTWAEQDLTSLISGLTIDANTNPSMSTDCNRIKLNSDILFYNSGTSQWEFIGGSSGAFSFTAVNSQINIALVTDKIFKFDGVSAFSEYGSVTVTLLTDTVFYASGSMVVVASKSASGAEIKAFNDNGDGTYSECLAHSDTDFTAAPDILVSPLNTKICITGGYIPAGSATAGPKIDCFAIYYSTASSLSFAFPVQAVADPANTEVQLGDSVIYVRQTTAVSGSGSGASGNFEYLYYLSDEIYPESIFNRVISIDQATTWVKSIINATSSTLYTLMTEYTVSGKTVINDTEISSAQGEINSDTTSVIRGYTSDGVVLLCDPGCNNCEQTGYCEDCLDGFVYDSTAFVCLLCGPRCKTCNADDPNYCLTCFSGAYLANNLCQSCDAACSVCSGSASSCTSCQATQFYDGSACQSCGQDCLTCTNATFCDVCEKGFIAIADGSCRGCSIYCSNCSSTNITECTSCAPGLQLFEDQCIRCPDKCLECNGGVCATCRPGYRPNSSGVCVKRCSKRCKTCEDNLPDSCTSCYGSLTPDSNKECLPDLTCNSDTSCTECGQTLGYVPVAGECVACQTITNCTQCTITNLELCQVCADGFYVNDMGQCSACTSGCEICKSAQTCLGCADGYTLSSDVTEGQCIACASPCLTCLGSSDFCLSCETGFDPVGWKCQQQNYVLFSLLFTQVPATILADVDNIVTSLLNLLGQSQRNTIVWLSFKSGSTNATGNYNVASTESSTLSSAITSSGTIGSYSVVSSSVTAVGGTTSTDSDDDSSNLGLILGTSIGGALLLVLAIIISVIVYRRKKMQEEKVDSEFREKEDREERPAEQNNRTNAELIGVHAEGRAWETLVLEDSSMPPAEESMRAREQPSNPNNNVSNELIIGVEDS